MDAHTVAIADVNGDGEPDLLVANCGPSGCGGGQLSGSVAVLLGRGDGTFQSAVTYGSGSFFSITAVDMDADGKPDIVAANLTCPNSSTGCVNVFRGNGDGTFQSAQAYDSGSLPNAVSVADLNGDGRPDLLATHGFGNGINLPPGTVDVLLNDTTFPPIPTATFLFGFPHRGPVSSYLAIVTSSDGAALLGHVTFIPGGNHTIFRNHTRIVKRWPYFDFGTVQSVIAVYSGDKHHLGSTSNVVLDPIPQGTSFMRVVTSGSPSLVGQPVTIDAQVNGAQIPRDGTLITFFDGQTLLGTAPLHSGGAAFTTASFSVGTHGIKANFPGDMQFTPSSAAVTQVVDKYATTTTLSSAPNPSLQKQAVTFTVAVASGGPSVPAGSVKFLDGTSWLGSAKLTGGVATLTKSTLTVGTHSITVQYLGDAVSAASASTVLSQVVQ